MRLVFWLNSFSPHQIPYISKLKDDERVTDVDVVVSEILNDKRKASGWLPNEIGGGGIPSYNLYVAPGNDTIKHLLQKESDDSIHLFSGIRAFPFVYEVLNMSLQYPIKRGFISERPNTFAYGCGDGKPLWLHKIRFLLMDRKYIPYINYVFAIGEEAVNYFGSLSLKWSVYPFIYCTEKRTSINSTKDVDEKVRFVYVGGMEWWKNPIAILKASEKYGRCAVFDFVGNGSQIEHLKELSGKLSERTTHEYHFLGTIENAKISQFLSAHDVLILPSKYDGWGAVVNEALQSGCYCIVSDRCGASELVKNSNRGVVFKAGDVNSLGNAIEKCCLQIEDVRESKEERNKWTEMHISGNIIARYMVDCLCGHNVKAPWRD